jgi:MOSC domain-containing protein YiiM
VDGRTSETCAECGFDARDWTVQDAVSLLDALGLWWQLATSDLPATAVNRRPGPTVWSALEYGVHSALVTAVLRAGIETILARDGSTLPAPPAAEPTPSGAPPELDARTVAGDLEREGHALAALARGAAPEAWAHAGHVGDHTVQAEAALFHAVHDATHHWMDVGRGLAALGAGAPAAAGRVTHVNVSNGGVPKRPIDRGSLGRRGLDGDHQAERRHHGRPFQAVCVWSADVIDALARAGHPIAPGSAGENLTLSGVDWATLRPGTRLRVGSALTELSFPATPCAKQTRWFADGDFRRIGHDRNPQWTRWYGWVREPGVVQPGDAVVVQPGDPDPSGEGRGTATGRAGRASGP